MVRKNKSGNINIESFYEKYVKIIIDRILSFVALIVLLPVYVVISVAIYVDDPGPVIFTQKRIGKNKCYIYIHKFRSMKLSTPHEVPTHQLLNPEQYITRVGRILRKYSLDELPQIWDIFRGKMSIIGPRPALWNQKDLIEEREKYNANSSIPGLTGWAQINGRDELEIPVKARLDGEYIRHLRAGGIEGFIFDIKCFFGTVKSVIMKEGIVEGGTGQMHRDNASSGKMHLLIISQYFYPETFRINDIAQEWVKRGYKVTVLTGIPNYPQGKYYEGYGLKNCGLEQWNEIDIIRIPLIPRGSNSICLVANYLSFVFAGYLWKIKSGTKADLVFTFGVSPITQALVGCWYAKKHRIPHYLYLQDLWPENVEVITGIHNRAILTPINKMVDYIYKNTDEIFVTSPSFINAVVNRKKSVDYSKVHYWPQYAEEFYKVLDRDKVYLEMDEKSLIRMIPNNNIFKIVFTGTIGYAQGLDVLPKVAELLKKEKVHFIVVGEGRYQHEFEKEILERNVRDMFTIIPRQPSERIPEILAVCDAGFISFMNTELFGMTIPAKLQSYMACGIPVIAVAKGETKRVIMEAECGVCSPIGDITKLADQIKEMMVSDLSNMKKNGRTYFEKYFDKKMLMDQMDKYLMGNDGL